MSKRSLKILILKKSGCFLPSTLQGCADTYVRLGHIIKVIDLDLLKEEILEREVIEARSDFVFCINHMGLPPELLLKVKIPHACWFIDDPFYWVKEDPASSYRAIFIWDKAFIPKLKKFGFNHVYPLPHCANQEIFHKVDFSDSDLKEYRCDVSFMGGSYYRSFEILEGLLKEWNETKIREISDEVIRIQSENLSLHIYDILETVQAMHQYYIPFADREGMIMFGRILAGAASSRYREKVVNSLTRFDLRLYGDGGWENLLKGEKVKYLGFVPDRDILKLFIASKINLNLATTQIKTILGERPFEILAVGGFVLTDYCSDIGSLFELDKEIACFREAGELEEKIGYFLNHPKEREEIARRGQERVLREHTYKHRMEQLVNTMRRIFG